MIKVGNLVKMKPLLDGRVRYCPLSKPISDEYIGELTSDSCPVLIVKFEFENKPRGRSTFILPPLVVTILCGDTIACLVLKGIANLDNLFYKVE
jgi:hypothetical protein